MKSKKEKISNELTLEEIKRLKEENERLKKNLLVVSDILRGVLDNIRVINTSIYNIYRIMSPILKPRGDIDGSNK